MELNSLKAPTCLRSAFLNGAWPMSLLSKSSRSSSAFSLLRSTRSFAPRSTCIVFSAGSPSISDFSISSNNVRMPYSRPAAAFSSATNSVSSGSWCISTSVTDAVSLRQLAGSRSGSSGETSSATGPSLHSEASFCVLHSSIADA